MERFGLDDVQAQAIVQMRLGQLTGLERTKLEEELCRTAPRRLRISSTSSQAKRRYGIIKDEAMEMKRLQRRAPHGDRRHFRRNGRGRPHPGGRLRLDTDELRLRKAPDARHVPHTAPRRTRHLRMSRREEDVASELFIANSHDFCTVLLRQRGVYRLKCYEIPEGSRTSRGMNITNLLPLEPGGAHHLYAARHKVRGGRPLPHHGHKERRHQARCALCVPQCAQKRSYRTRSR